MDPLSVYELNPDGGVVMPSAQKMIAKANAIWRRENLDRLDSKWFADPFVPGERLAAWSEYITNHIAETPAERDIALAFPEGLREMLRALLYLNLRRRTPLEVQWAWLPGYDWELTVAECPGTAVSPGAITVLIRGRYPLDPHPSTIRDRGPAEREATPRQRMHLRRGARKK
jgi:hypothetical protein